MKDRSKYLYLIGFVIMTVAFGVQTARNKADSDYAFKVGVFRARIEARDELDSVRRDYAQRIRAHNVRQEGEKRRLAGRYEAVIADLRERVARQVPARDWVSLEDSMEDQRLITRLRRELDSVREAYARYRAIHPFDD